MIEDAQRHPIGNFVKILKYSMDGNHKRVEITVGEKNFEER